MDFIHLPEKELKRIEKIHLQEDGFYLSTSRWILSIYYKSFIKRSEYGATAFFLVDICGILGQMYGEFLTQQTNFIII